MMPIASILTGAAGAALVSRFDNRGAQLVGGGVIALALSMAASPAFADQALTVDDNARIECVASKNDLTRISLVGDEFASVSKVQAESPLDDFSVVNEPTRGDIYVSVPSGYRPKALSFFGTSKKGFVYKFACRVDVVEAQQIFLTNPGAAQETAKAQLAQDDGEAPDADETAVRLIQSMAEQRVVPGFKMERAALVPVKSGSLTVQLIAEYRGIDLTGRVVRIENTGKAAVELTEGLVAPSDALAVAIANPRLEGRQVTTAYVVVRKGPRS